MYNNVKSYVSEAISNAALDFDDYETPKKAVKKTKAVKKVAKKTTKTSKKKK